MLRSDQFQLGQIGKVGSNIERPETSDELRNIIYDIIKMYHYAYDFEKKNIQEMNNQ